MGFFFPSIVRKVSAFGYTLKVKCYAYCQWLTLIAAIGGHTGELLQQNKLFFQKISANFSSYQVSVQKYKNHVLSR